MIQEINVNIEYINLKHKHYKQLKVTASVWRDTSGQNCPGILPHEGEAEATLDARHNLIQKSTELSGYLFGYGQKYIDNFIAPSPKHLHNQRDV